MPPTPRDALAHISAVELGRGRVLALMAGVIAALAGRHDVGDLITPSVTSGDQMFSRAAQASSPSGRRTSEFIGRQRPHADAAIPAAAGLVLKSAGSERLDFLGAHEGISVERKSPLLSPVNTGAVAHADGCAGRAAERAWCSGSMRPRILRISATEGKPPSSI
jgi:murein DD-endopeptidase MepM/ murein hydrolase activator NlpD